MNFGTGACVVLGCTSTGTLPTSPGLMNNMITLTCGGTALGIEVRFSILVVLFLGEHGHEWSSNDDYGNIGLHRYRFYFDFKWRNSSGYLNNMYMIYYKDICTRKVLFLLLIYRIEVKIMGDFAFWILVP